jgi:hypothetical protein
MTDFSVRSDNVDIEQLMRQIRSRIREKRGVDYTEDEIRELANVKLEKFLDPRGVRSDLLEEFRRKREASLPPALHFEDTTLYETHRWWLRVLRRLLRPILLMLFNPNALINALHSQSKLSTRQAALEPLYYEVIHNLVLETTRLGIEVKNLKMRVESMSSRLDFDERRARALEGVVQYRPGAVPPLQPPGASGGGDRPLTEAEQAERRSRRRRRRGRRRPGDRFDGAEGSSAPSTREGESARSGQGPSTRDAESARSGQGPREQGPRGPRGAEGTTREGSGGAESGRDQAAAGSESARNEGATDVKSGVSGAEGARDESGRGEGAKRTEDTWRDPGEGGASSGS